MYSQNFPYLIYTILRFVIIIIIIFLFEGSKSIFYLLYGAPNALLGGPGPPDPLNSSTGLPPKYRWSKTSYIVLQYYLHSYIHLYSIYI